MLNPQQQKAVEQIEGQLLILAGAGSGKTSTLTARVDYMIREKNISPSSIMCVTFTNKAALEMKHRIGDSLGVSITGNLYKDKTIPLVGTFHSIGVFFLKQYIETLGYKKDFIIYDESDKISVLKNIIKEILKLDEKTYPPRMVAFHISNAKNTLLTPSTYEKYADNQFKKIVSRVYAEYEKVLKQNNALDFDDILLKTLDILKKPEILDILQEKYKYIMVDEYQDTNSPQYEIIKLLASKYKNLCVVGDDWQSIYSFRGADMRNIINFKKDYLDATIIKLEQNYRSTKKIISRANYVIKQNKTALEKTLWTDNEDGETIKSMLVATAREEARQVVKLIESVGAPYSKNLILYRTNSQSRELEESLLLSGIPYKVVGGFKFYDRKEIKDILSYLKVIYNSFDVVALKRIINIPSRKIGAKTIEVLDNYRAHFGLSYLELIENVREIDELNLGAKQKVNEFLDIYKDLRLFATTNTVSSLIKYIIKKISYEDYLLQEEGKEGQEERIANIGELIKVASNFDTYTPQESLQFFLEEVALITDMEDKNTETSDFVTLMTIHTSKGLEFERVFIVGLEDGIFPHSRSFMNPSELEEERRLMYVAMTRAKKELYLSRATERFYNGNYVSYPVSRFLKEIPDSMLEMLEIKKQASSFFSSSSSFSSRLASETTKPVFKPKAQNDVSSFAVGDRLSHSTLGTGVIISISGEIADIAFSGIIKKMNLKIAPVTKI